MSNVTIKSKNQSGGITAQNVNSSTNESQVEKAQTESRAKQIFWWVFGVAGVIGAAAAVVALVD